jgi:hypothetical protein
MRIAMTGRSITNILPLILTIFLFITPTPAPPVIVPIIGAAAAVNSAVGAVGAGTSAIISGAVSGVIGGVVGSQVDGKNDKRSSLHSVFGRQEQALCLQDVMQAGMPKLESMDDGTYMIYGVPYSCMQSLEVWNGLSGIAEYESMYGCVASVNGSSLVVYDVPNTMQGMLKGLVSMVSSGSTGGASSASDAGRWHGHRGSGG